MSLISTTNFLAPFRSKVQIGLVLVTAVLVGVIRFAGTSGYEGSHGASTDRAPVGLQPLEKEVNDFLAERNKVRKKEAPRGDRTIDNLFTSPDEEAPRRPAASNASNDSVEPGKLNDIKRSLGME